MPSRATVRAALLAGAVLAVGLVPSAARAADGDTVSVTSCTEAALRAAVADAPDGGTVAIACDDPILLTPGGGSTIVVDKTLTISGTGHAVTIDGGQATSLFVVQAGPDVRTAADLPTLTLRDLTLTRGWSQDQELPGGGAVYNLASLVAERVAFVDNRAFNRGGAILSEGHGSLTVVDSTFDDNRVTCPLDGAGGGAIAVRQAQQTTISGSSFTGNTATGFASGGAVLAYVSTLGAGFPVEPPPAPLPPHVLGGPLVVTDSTFTGNSVTVNGVWPERMYGGGALAVLDHPLTVTDSLFEDNTVSGIVGYGGAILAASIRDVPTTLTTVDVLGNGFPDRIGELAANGIGGGLALHGTPATVEDTIVEGNRAFVGGGLYTRGGPVELVASWVDANTAGAVNLGVGNHGGGLATRGPITLTDSQLLGNAGGSCLVLYAETALPPTGDVIADGGANDVEGAASCFRRAVPPAPPPATGPLAAPATPTLPGSPVPLTGSGFAPAARVTLVGYPLSAAAVAPGLAAAAPVPVDLGAGQADDAGAFSATPVLPGDGVWQVLALGLDGSGTPVTLQAVVVVAAAGVDVAPALVDQPASVTAAVGTTVTLTATAAGAPAPSVQWQRSTDGTTWTDVPGASGTSLDVPVTAGGASYRAVFTNPVGTVTSAVAMVSGPGGAPGGPGGPGGAGGGAVVPVAGPAAAAGGPALAVTGTDLLPVAGAGLALALAGGALIRFGRRRQIAGKSPSANRV